MSTTVLDGRTFDVCVIGSGASGAVAAAELVKRGFDVVVVEQGTDVAGRSYDDVVRDSEPAYARTANGCWSLIGYPWTTCNVGGGTVFYGGASFRLREADFNAGLAFADADLPVDWPIAYSTLEPYYDEVEATFGIAVDARDDPTAPAGRCTSALPAVTNSASGAILRSGGASLGLKPFPTPLAIATQPYGGRLACQPVAPCMERACDRGAKGDVATVLLEPLAREPNFTLLQGLKAVALRHGDGNRAVAVLETLDAQGGSRHRVSARTFVVAANAIQSAALLLRSRDERRPTGMGNRHDMVGRGLCFKLNEFVTGYVGPDLAGGSVGTPGGLGPFSTVSFTDFYGSADCPTGVGGLIYENQHAFRYAMRSDESILRLECLLADQPARTNKVALADTTDANGLRHVVLDYQAHPRDLARLEYMVERMIEILEACGARWIRREPSDFQLGSCHLHGTCRAGDDPETSVVDATGRVHDVDNLYVVDGSTMPFPGGVNPTLTIQANALRMARGLVVG